MPVHDPKATPRFLVDYTSYNEPHVLQVRFPVPTLDSDVANFLLDLSDSMKALMWDSDAILGARKIPAGTNVSIPFPVIGLDGAGTAIVTPVRETMKTSFFSATGKDSAGVDVRVTMFCMIADDFIGYRQPIGVVSTVVSNWWADIQSDGTISTCTVGGGTPFWNAYVNRGNNSHFQRKNR